MLAVDQAANMMALFIYQHDYAWKYEEGKGGDAYEHVVDDDVLQR